eukprot:2739868-Pleurochrysis_carterae.AAC.3
MLVQQAAADRALFEQESQRLSQEAEAERRAGAELTEKEMQRQERMAENNCRPQWKDCQVMHLWKVLRPLVTLRFVVAWPMLRLGLLVDCRWCVGGMPIIVPRPATSTMLHTHYTAAQHDAPCCLSSNHSSFCSLAWTAHCLELCELCRGSAEDGETGEALAKFYQLQLRMNWPVA